MVKKQESGSLEELIYSKYKSQASCAKALGWPRQKLNYIVTGQRVPSLQDSIDLAEVLQVSIGVISQKILSNKSTKI